MRFQYNVDMKTSGIYAILAPSGHMYIGSAANISVRWAHHRNALRRGDHANVALQAAFAKYGEQLVYLVLEECAVADLIACEQAAIDALPFEQLYNIARFVETPTRGRKFTAEHRAKIAAKAIGRTHTEETRAKMRGARPYSAANHAAAKTRAAARVGVARTDLPVGKSGYRGVYKQKRGGWFARVGVGAARYDIGTYKTPDLAYAMRLVWLANGGPN